MKNISISLTDHHAAAIEAELAGGGFASTSEVIRAALRAYFDPGLPSEEQMLADALEAEAEVAAGGKTYSADEMRQHIREILTE